MNVIWIISDSFRRDYLGTYGNKLIHTPSLDIFAAKSLRFMRHYAAGFPTMPNRADLATGLWTMSFMGWESLPRGVNTLAEILSKNNIHTAAIVDTPFYIRYGMNYDRGFQTFFLYPGQEPGATRMKDEWHHESRDTRSSWLFESDHNAPSTIRKAVQWLEKHYKEHFFLCVDTWDPHEPWDAPIYYTENYWANYDGEIIHPLYSYWQDEPGFTEEKVKKALATYCGEIQMVDTWIGFFLRCIENMGLMEKTAIIFTSDHGFYFGEHGGIFGKMIFGAKDPNGQILRTGEAGAAWGWSPLYEEVAAIPLLIYLPGFKPCSYNYLTSAIDIMPTTLELFGIEIPSYVEGKSILQLFQSGRKSREFVITSVPFANPGDWVGSVDNTFRSLLTYTVTTITNEEWSFLYTPEKGMSQLFHLSTDPKQENNIIGNNVDIAHEMHKILIKFMRNTSVKESLINPRLHLNL